MFFLFLILTGISCASDHSGNHNVTDRFEFFLDPKTDIPFEQIQKQTSWKQISKTQLSFNFTSDVIWLRGKTEEVGFSLDRILSLEWKALDSAILYYPVSRKEFQTFETGDTIPKSKLALPEALYPSFQIPKHAEGNYFYIRIQSKSLISFPIRSMEERSFNKRIVLETAITWLILGVCVVMIVFALFYYFAFGLSEFFFYAGYVVCTVLWYNGQYGNAYDVFWPELS